MGGRIYHLTARQILERSKDMKTLQAVYDRLYLNHIHGVKYPDNPGHFVYPVDDDFFMTRQEAVARREAKGYVSVDTLAKRFGLSKPTVCKKICGAGLAPDETDVNRVRWWKDGLWTWGLFNVPPPPEVVEKFSGESSETAAAPRKKSERKPEHVRFGNPDVDSMLDMEEEKRKWIGKRGRIIVNGRVAVEGIIESVSSCGVYVKGSNVRGNINELELCSAPEDRVERSRVSD